MKIKQAFFTTSLFVYFLLLSITTHAQKSLTAQAMEDLGFCLIQKLDSTIEVSLVYATDKNFMGEILYEDLSEAYLHPLAAEALVSAQNELKNKKPGFTLLVYDAARPMRIQQKMWDKVKGTSKYKYVSNPANGGGLHNYGLAVDVTIIDAKGCELDMGTPIDFFGSAAHIDKERDLVAKGVLTKTQVENRELLREVMVGSGFKALRTEWWHFNWCSRAYAKQHFKVIQ